jgi:DNA-binding response OmpR family regulator
VVEDYPTVGETLKVALEQAGHAVQLFADGPSTLSGVSLLSNADDFDHYFTKLADVRALPFSNGFLPKTVIRRRKIRRSRWRILMGTPGTFKRKRTSRCVCSSSKTIRTWPPRRPSS